jgi:predicted nucleic acid-binding protein
VILADTSIWVDHLRRSRPALEAALSDGVVGLHPFVIGELALGRLHRRREILTLLASLPRLSPTAHVEVLRFVDLHDLPGSGLGWVDAHLLCAARLAGWQVWSADRRLAAVAARLGLAASG